ncbi:hypothetical protein CN586_08555 [Bacillus toyonensis]|uniref:hypothetical protein n=1 Tax=Bacillus toyonensis TaxID=155322 RepID=UPI000BF0E63A|nr:hypothetical protein [Bacillus toyonensis]PEK51545.1 hypothetical protein CN586_08555 [Bacillus toyonensis]
MQNTTTTGAILQTLPIKDVIISNEISIQGNFLNALKSIPYNGKTKIIPVSSYKQENGDPHYKSPSTPVLEGNNAKERTIKFEGKKLPLIRFAEKIVLSEQFKDNTDEENINIALEMALNLIMPGITQQLLVKGYDDNPGMATDDTINTGIAKLFSSANSPGSSKINEPLKYKDVHDVYQAIKLTGKTNRAFWLINSSAFFSVLDDFGNEHLSFDNVPEGAGAILFGLPVYLVNGIYDNNLKEIAFGLVHPDAYSVTISDVNVIQPKLDTAQAMNGSKVYIVEVWAGGRSTDHLSKRSVYFAPQVQQASVTEQSIDEPKPVKRKATKIEKE